MQILWNNHITALLKTRSHSNMKQARLICEAWNNLDTCTLLSSWISFSRENLLLTKVSLGKINNSQDLNGLQLESKQNFTSCTVKILWDEQMPSPLLLCLHVKWRSAKSRQPVLTSLYRSVYIVWKSFTCGRRVDEHLLCRLVNKGLYGVGKHAHWLQISRSWQLLFMPVMKLVPWTMDRAAHCKIHP